RHEAGSPNVVGAYAVAAACRALLDTGFERLVLRERRLLDRLLTGLAAVPGLRVLSLFGERAERVGVVSFVLAGWESGRVAAALAEEYGIGVRDGLFCAHPLLRVLLGQAGDQPAECPPSGGEGRDTAAEPGAEVDAYGDTLAAVRVSFGAGTPDEHIERLLGAVRELAARHG
ncbi:aminotransferase class V-fold PLP-dependent enzyme, partial [Streptomyces oceani]